MTPSEAREVLNKMLNYSTEIGLLVDSGNYDVAHKAISVAIAALEAAPTISEEELIAIYNLHYGDDIDNLKQIKSHMFDGLELFEFVNAVLTKKGGHNDGR